MSWGTGQKQMQDHKTKIPNSCRQTLLNFSQEKDEEKRQREI